MGQQGGIIHQEAPIFASQGYAGLPQLRQAHPRSHTSCLMTATKVRLCKKCGETF